MEALPDMQLQLRPGIAEFGWGHPNPALLPVGMLAEAAAAALGARGVAALSYGPEQGPGSLMAQIQARLGRSEGAEPPLAQLMVTGGISQALDMLCGLLGRPGDAVLVEAPTYHLALRIFQDRELVAVPVPGDDDGMLVEAAAEALRRLRAAGRRVAFLYVVATFGNPSGAVLAPGRRAALVALAEREGLTVIEDDAYGELWYDEPVPASLFSLVPAGPVVRLGSYAKVLAPGLRLGWMLAAPQLVARCLALGVLDSGGAVNQFTAMVLASLLEAGHLDGHVARLRDALRGRRDALLAALAAHMPPGCSWGPARGGFFVWVRLPEPLDAAALLPAAEAAGVAYLPGERFHAGGGGASRLRLSFSLLPEAELAEGAARLGAVVRRATQVV